MYTCICVYRAGIFTSSWNELWDPEAFPLAEQSSEQAFGKSCLWALVHRPSDTVVFIGRSQDPSPLETCCPNEGSQDQTPETWVRGTCAPTCRGLGATVLWGRRQLQRALTMMGTDQAAGEAGGQWGKKLVDTLPKPRCRVEAAPRTQID